MSAGKGERSAWVFHGEGAKFACAVFENLNEAKLVINREKLTGLLTKYNVGTTVYDYLVERNLLHEQKPSSPERKQRFTSALMEHYHFIGGQLA